MWFSCAYSSMLITYIIQQQCFNGCRAMGWACLFLPSWTNAKRRRSIPTSYHICWYHCQKIRMYVSKRRAFQSMKLILFEIHPEASRFLCIHISFSLAVFVVLLIRNLKYIVCADLICSLKYQPTWHTWDACSLSNLHNYFYITYQRLEQSP